MGNPYYVTYNNGNPTPVAYQRAFYTNNQSNNPTISISQDAPEVYDVTGGQYSCGRDINALGAGDYGASSLGATWNRIVNWARSDKGQKTLMIAASTVGIIAGVALIATGAGSGIGARLIAVGASSLIGGYINERRGGSFLGGWVGGAASGLISSFGFSAAGALYNAATISSSTGAVLQYGLSSFAFGGAGAGVGAFASNAVVQKIDTGEVNWEQAAQNGIITGISEGKTTITVKSNNAGMQNSTTINVTGYASGDWSYENLTDGTIKITKYLGNSENIVVPAKIDGHEVSLIARRTFGSINTTNKTAKTVTVSNGIKTIEFASFSYLDNVDEIIIPASVNSITSNAFEDSKIKKFVVDKNNQNYMSIDDVLYEKKDNQPVSVINYPSNKNNTTYAVPDTVKEIDYRAVVNNEYLKEIYLPENVTSVVNTVFVNLVNLEKIYIYNPKLYMYHHNENTTIISKCPNVVIYGYKDSKAEEYAGKIIASFVPLDVKISFENNALYTSKGGSITNNVITNYPVLTFTGYTWKSSNTKIATVDSNGKVTALDNGNAVISASKVINGITITANYILNVTDILKGDMNQNGRIDLSDIIILLKKYLGTLEIKDNDLSIGDMSNNNKIDLSDIIRLLRIYLNS